MEQCEEYRLLWGGTRSLQKELACWLLRWRKAGRPEIEWPLDSKETIGQDYLWIVDQPLDLEFSEREPGALAPLISKEIQWVRDDDRTRGFHNKTVQIKNGDNNLGVFIMKVSDTGQNGEKKDGFVIVSLELYDLDSGFTAINNGL